MTNNDVFEVRTIAMLPDKSQKPSNNNNKRVKVMKVLIVEDNPSEQFLFKEQIRSLGHDVTTCSDVETASGAGCTGRL